MKRLLIPFVALALMAGAPARAADDEALRGLTMLTHTLSTLWKPDCSVRLKAPLEIRLKIAAGGRISEGPTWDNSVDAPDARNAVLGLMQTIVANQPYSDLPATIYDKTLVIEFDQVKACGQTR